ncbi:hypothetical protein Pcinc_042255 [Petrolisthes cinctipes]|uniref:Uncharacterized protein n=1 Tax=Petrolisthes cinctipes TaxID=88211 RepID=A0AAE1BLL9_PETCI|nr:hypothetical protein Pcinc_042255 [Petrolisthes cinctipes]
MKALGCLWAGIVIGWAGMAVYSMWAGTEYGGRQRSGCIGLCEEKRRPQQTSQKTAHRLLGRWTACAPTEESGAGRTGIEGRRLGHTFTNQGPGHPWKEKLALVIYLSILPTPLHKALSQLQALSTSSSSIK